MRSAADGHVADPPGSLELEREIEALASTRRVWAVVQSISAVVLAVSLALGWNLVAAIAFGGLVFGMLMAGSWWLFLRGWRRPNVRGLSIEQLAREEIMAKRRSRSVLPRSEIEIPRLSKAGDAA